MKINLTKQDKEEFNKILELKDQNIEISDILLNAFAYTDFINIDDFNDRVSNGDSPEKAIKEIILDTFEIEDESFRKEFCNQIEINKCNPKDYQNEYVDLLDKIRFSYGKYNLKKVTYEPYQLFALDDIKVTKDLKEISRVGYFDQKFSYAALFEGKDLWMSLNPNEINTMASTIKRAKGNVLVLGLGMGYITYMLSMQKDVKSIIVVERNDEDIKLFNKFLFPKFKNASKIKIVREDAIKYVQNNTKFDYIYADLWFNPEDGLEYYLTLNEIEKEKNITIDYWLETSLKQMKRRYLIELIKEQMDGLDESHYKSEQEIADRIFKKLYYNTKGLEINSIKEIKDLLK